MNFPCFALTVCILVLILFQTFAVEQVIPNKCYSLYSASVGYVLYRVLYL